MVRIVIFALAIALLFPGGTVVAASKKKNDTLAGISPIVQQATVNLYCKFKLGKKYFSTSGSGVFIDSRGVILTNAHVAQYFFIPPEKSTVKGTCSVRTGSPAQETYTAEVLYFPYAWAKENIVGTKKNTDKGTGENDAALLYVTGAEKNVILPTAFPALSIDTLTQTKTDTAVTVVGYPIEDLEFDDIRGRLPMSAASSTVTKVSGFTAGHSDLLTIASSAIGRAGVSGGPVLAASNSVIGIVATKSTAKDDRTVRAISLPYIDRMVTSETGFTLRTLLLGDFGARASMTKAALPEDTLKTLKSRFLKQR